MTDNEIIKALECCKNHHNSSCFGCYLIHDTDCFLTLSSSALDLINRLQAENEKWQGGYMTQKQEIANLEIEFKAMRGVANSYKAENERLKAHIKEGIDLAKQVPEMIALAQNEAIEEFAERLHYLINPDWCKLHQQIDNLVKEMVGEG